MNEMTTQPIDEDEINLLDYWRMIIKRKMQRKLENF